MSDPLDDILREWHVDAAPPPDLNVRVRADIDRRSRRPWFAEAALLLDDWFLQPRALAACLAVAFVLGMVFGELRVRSQEGRVEQEMTERYLALLDPSDR